MRRSHRQVFRIHYGEEGSLVLAQLSHLTGSQDRPIFWACKGQFMVRSVIALVVALSVAMLPVAGGIAAPEEIPSASELATSAHDCCDHDGMPADNVMKDCQAAAGCAAKCFSVCGMVVSNPLSHPQVTGAEPFFETKTFRPQAGIAPFRPPRV